MKSWRTVRIWIGVTLLMLVITGVSVWYVRVRRMTALKVTAARTIMAWISGMPPIPESRHITYTGNCEYQEGFWGASMIQQTEHWYVSYDFLPSDTVLSYSPNIVRIPSREVGSLIDQGAFEEESIFTKLYLWSISPSATRIEAGVAWAADEGDLYTFTIERVGKKLYIDVEHIGGP